ncbi:MAG: hypothetical protein HY097_02010 [Nitrospinae bacterium]|nr:hypothetical protein [Nitrospinota bacterium]
MNERPNEVLNELSKAITNALIKSDEVINMLFDLKKQNMIEPSAKLAFIIKVNDIINIAEKLSEVKSLVSGQKSEYVDGRKLTKNEIAFEDYLSEKFNETDWLKKHGIIF